MMPVPSLIILGYSEASMLLRSDRGRNIVAIISIRGEREFRVDAPDSIRRLNLVFDDVEVPVLHDALSLQRVHARRKWAAQNGLTETAPTVDDARAIVAFAESLREAGGNVLCHCGGGMSRAPAAALICLSVWRGAGSEAECVREVRTIRRGAVPHVGLIRFADELLGRDGRLLSALG